MKTAINNKAIELKVEGLKDADVITLIRKDVKRHQDSIEQFKKGNRDDLVKKDIKANDIIKDVAPVMQGSGGGRPQMAQAGSKETSHLDKALKKAVQLAKEKLSK